MYENKLRLTVASILIFGHVITFGTLIYLWHRGGFLFDEMVTVFAIMAPLFAAYTAISIKYVFRTAALRRRGKRWNIVSVSVALLFPLAFLSLVNGLLFSKAFGALSDFDNVVRAFGLIETGFAAYVGQVVNQLLSDD